MNLKYFQNKSGGVYELLLFGGIGEEVRGNDVAKEIKYLNNIGATKIVEKINSGGGSILDGLSIISANLDSKVPIETHNEGVAASMAGLIFVTGTVRKMRDYATLMIHNPSMGGTSLESMPESREKRALIAMKTLLLNILSKNGNKTKPDLNKMMSEETWLTAKEAKEMGFVDKIVITQARNKPSLNLAEMQESEDILLSAVNKCNLFYKSKISMENVTNYLNLQAEASQEAILNAVKKIETARDVALTELAEQTNKVTSLEDSLRASNTTIENLKNEVESFREKEIESMVDEAIKAKKFSEADKEDLVKMAKDNTEMFKALVDKVTPMFESIKNEITPSAKRGDKLEASNQKLVEKYKAMTDAEREEMANTNPKEFNDMLNAYAESK